MARPLRIEYPGAYYHVISRGNGGEDIFKSKRDREKFLDYLEKMVERYAVRIHCYCMMTNHYHLLLETPEANLSQSIQWLNVSYAMYFNTKRNRRGHLFQGRFKSILVDADEYFKHLSRYIHLNPIRVGLVDALVDYPWSSYCAFVGDEKKPEWLLADWILMWFGKNRKAAQKDYRDFVESIDTKYLENPSKDMVGGLILGCREFVDWVRESHLSARQDDIGIKGLRVLKISESIDDVVQRVAAYYGCAKDDILAKGKKKNIARDIAIYVAREKTGAGVVEIGRHFGGIRGQAVNNRYTKIKELLPTDRRMKRDLKKLVNNG